MQEKNCLATDKEQAIFSVQCNFGQYNFISKNKYVFFQTEPNGKFVCSGCNANLVPVFNKCSNNLVNVYSIIYVWCPTKTLINIQANQPVDNPISIFKDLKIEYEAIKINGDNSVEELENGEWKKNKHFTHSTTICKEEDRNENENQIKDSVRARGFKNFIGKNVGKIVVSIIFGLVIGTVFGFVFAPATFALLALLMFIDYKIQRLPKPIELASNLIQGCKNVFGKLKVRPFQLIKNKQEQNKQKQSLEDEEKK